MSEWLFPTPTLPIAPQQVFRWGLVLSWRRITPSARRSYRLLLEAGRSFSEGSTGGSHRSQCCHGEQANQDWSINGQWKDNEKPINDSADWRLSSGSQEWAQDSSAATIRFRKKGSLLNRWRCCEDTSIHFDICSAVRTWGTHLEQTFLIPKFSLTICQVVPWLSSVAIWSIVILWSCWIRAWASY